MPPALPDVGVIADAPLYAIEADSTRIVGFLILAVAVVVVVVGRWLRIGRNRRR